ncbi:MAG: SDR family oxidoreductase [Pelagibacterales bacterium]|nr:SDR family oxidoreductase [Pelagibacterales bacterium]
MARALVLGGNGDIGKAIANQLRLDGFETIAVGRNDFNLNSSDQIKDYFSKNGANFDIIVHSAGMNHPKLFEELSDEEINQSLDINLRSFLQIVRICLPHLKNSKHGRVVVISSLYGFFARRGRLPYVMAKHALNGAVKTLAIELASSNVLVNSVSPGYIETKMTYANNSEEVIKKFISGIPLSRLGKPQDIADTVSFLCSEKNKYITGQDIVVDGGFSVGGFQ